jgi:hypothetical protein
MDVSSDEIVPIHVNFGNNADGSGVCNYVSQNHPIINLVDFNIISSATVARMLRRPYIRGQIVHHTAPFWWNPAIAAAS